MSRRPLGLLEGIGVELEYMIVDAQTLDVLPIADEVLRTASGEIESEQEHGRVAWSNELVAHVIEFKTNGPVHTLDGLAEAFQHSVEEVDRALRPLGGRLLPTGMHPWMDPHTQTRIWPHDDHIIYEAFNRLFDCRGHGWSNLQSTHINLSFATAREFGLLHAACRAVLPLLPALAASTPVADSRISGLLDTRLEAYRTNAARVAEMTGQVIPEPAFTPSAYRQQILEPLYRAMEPMDPGGTLRHEWANARGCIARFDRGAIEIRVLDIQECPAADLAIVDLVVATVRSLCRGDLMDTELQRLLPTDELARLFRAVLREGRHAPVELDSYLGLADAEGACTVGDIWSALLERLRPDLREESLPILDVIVHEGSLSERILAALPEAPGASDLHGVYGELATCLHEGRLFDATRVRTRR